MKMFYCKNEYTNEEAIVVAIDENEARKITQWNNVLITDSKEIKAIIIGKRDANTENKTSDRTETII